MPTQSRPRSPGIAYGIMALAFVLLLSLVALTAREAPPPTIAEFAPQAFDRIVDSPADQTSKRGSAAGDVDGSATPSPAPDAAAVDVPRVRRCVGDPPRQTEDPQSPPCVPYWAGENGGATARGVTASEIRIALPNTFDNVPVVQRLVDHFNRRYEFYGRKIRLLPFQTRWGVFGGEPAQLTADAVDVDEKLNAYGSLGLIGGGEMKFNYYNELARRQILAIDSDPTPMREPEYQRHDPYLWQVFPAFDEWQRQIGSWMCSSLHDKPPTYADPSISLASPKRVFGLVIGRTSSVDDTVPDATVLRDTLARCGGSFAVERHATGDATGDQNSILAFQAENVTSIVCLCDGGNLIAYLMPSASSQGYFPEWLVQSYHYQDREDTTQAWPPPQAAHAFGLTFYNKFLPPGDMPWNWALRESDPDAKFDANQYLFIYSRYMQLLMLASGLQFAGPHLTAETFGRGLRSIRYPNPGCGTEPFFQACVGVKAGSHTLVHDAAMIWWSPSDEGFMGSQSGQRGTYCYVDRGRRAQAGSWPTDPAYFTQPCR